MATEKQKEPIEEFRDKLVQKLKQKTLSEHVTDDMLIQELANAITAAVVNKLYVDRLKMQRQWLITTNIVVPALVGFTLFWSLW